MELVKLLPETAAARVAENRVGESKFFVRAGDEFIAAVERGDHDIECEKLRAPGFWVCNCSKRRREAVGHTEPPGDLEWVYPICPRCDDHVDSDGDTWTCPRCCAEWEQNGTGARFYDDHGDLTGELAAMAAAPKRRQIVDVHLPEPVGEVTT